MNGKMIKLQVAATDQTLPVLYPDSLLSPGSLVLLDASRLGIENSPTSGDYALNNIAKDTSAIMTGSDETGVKPIYKLTGYAASGMKVERTAKKGLHVVMSKVNDVASQYLQIEMPLKIRDYIAGNNGHKFYMSHWLRNTRLADTTTSAFAYFMQNTSNYYYNANALANTPDGATPSRWLGGKRSPGLAPWYNTTGNKFTSSGFTGVTGSPVNPLGRLFYVGNETAYGSFTIHKGWSMVLYRTYIEDLTVSGRTYAEVEAIDFDLYTKAFDVGGRFYGDTFSDPATILP